MDFVDEWHFAEHFFDKKASLIVSFSLFEQLKNKIDTQKIEEPWGWARIFLEKLLPRPSLKCVEKIKFYLINPDF